jgi:subtilisin family serine protease
VAGFWRVFLVVFLFTGTALAGPEKLDPLLRALVQAQGEHGPTALLSPQVLPELVALGRPGLPPEAPLGAARLRVFILTQEPEAALTIPAFYPHQIVGTLATGEVALGDLTSLAAHPQVVYVQASRPVYPSLDRSVPETGAPILWHATPSTTGHGVIVGVVDTGIDVLHRDFRVDRDGNGTEEGTRILYLWDQAGVGATGFPFWWGDVLTEAYYGRAFSREELEAAIASGFPPTRDTHGHGTHVAGIAASDGSASPANLRGVAPGADLVIVKTTFYEDTVVDGVRFVFEAARAAGRPAVVNLSLGGHGGPHDGSSLFERMLDALLDRPGRAIVVAAGNEGNRRIHVGGDVRARTTWHLEVEEPTVAVQLWHAGTSSFSAEVRAPSGETVTVLPGAQRWSSTASGGVWLDNTSLPDPRNLSRHIYLALTDVGPGATWAITLTPIIGGGRVDGWVEDPSAAQFREGGTSHTISEPGNAHRVITVGAYVITTRWTSVAGDQTADGEVGALAAFSSRGPTRDGRLKPDLTAPGAWIASARSQHATTAPWLTLPGDQYTVLLGTSMAAPHVAGAVALLFSRSPNLTWSAVKDALTAGARVDAHVGAAPNTSWGAGKLDIPRAAEIALGRPPVEAPTLFALANPVAHEAVFRYRCPDGTRWASLHVYDLRGRLLFTQLVALPAGEVRWPLRTTDGRPVASGLYLVVLVTDRARSDIVRLVVQR